MKKKKAPIEFAEEYARLNAEIPEEEAQLMAAWKHGWLHAYREYSPNWHYKGFPKNRQTVLCIVLDDDGKLHHLTATYETWRGNRYWTFDSNLIGIHDGIIGGRSSKVVAWQEIDRPEEVLQFGEWED